MAYGAAAYAPSCARRAGPDDRRQMDHPVTRPLPQRSRTRPEPSPRRACRLPRTRRRTHHWTCRTCDHTVYGPPLNTHCSVLDGPATVRISTARDCRRNARHTRRPGGERRGRRRGDSTGSTRLEPNRSCRRLTYYSAPPPALLVAGRSSSE